MEKRICFLFFFRKKFKKSQKKANDFMILNIFLNSCFLFSLFIEEKSFCICLFFLFLFSFFVQFHKKETWFLFFGTKEKGNFLKITKTKNKKKFYKHFFFSKILEMLWDTCFWFCIPPRGIPRGNII